jgi:hypothetical protein
VGGAERVFFQPREINRQAGAILSAARMRRAYVTRRSYEHQNGGSVPIAAFGYGARRAAAIGRRRKTRIGRSRSRAAEAKYRLGLVAPRNHFISFGALYLSIRACSRSAICPDSPWTCSVRSSEASKLSATVKM